MRTLKVLLGSIKTYPVIEGYDNLSRSQKDQVSSACWDEDDFLPYEKFWEVEGKLFSVEMDLHYLNVFRFNGWVYQYHFNGEDFVCRFSQNRKHIEIAKITVEAL